jgi:uncharacterized protein YabE (DUF348 family)
MKAMNWLQGRISDHWKKVTPLLAVGGFIFIFISSQKHVIVIINGESYMLSTHARSVGSLLDEMDIFPNPGDELFPGVNQPLERNQTVVYTTSSAVILDEEGELAVARTTKFIPENILAQKGVRIFPGDSLVSYGSGIHPTADQIKRGEHWLRIDRGHPIKLQVGNEMLEFSSSEPTLGEALWRAGIVLYEGDQLEPAPETILDSELSVTLRRASEYTILVDGQTINRRGTGDRVGEILANTGIGLVGLDYSLPGIDSPSPSDGVIQVVRVVEELLVELEPVEFETVYQPADQLELDTLEVLEPGTFGVQSKTIRIRFEDGEEVSRSIQDAVIAVEPKNRVIGYGTRIVVRTLDTGQGTIEYWRAIPIYATSYSPCNLGVPWCGTLTASGKPVYRGIIGVIRSWYNLMRGWSVFVPGYGPGTFEDIGAGIAGRDWIDLGFTDDNFEPWHQWTTLYFLTPVPSLDSIPWILP